MHTIRIVCTDRESPYDLESLTRPLSEEIEERFAEYLAAYFRLIGAVQSFISPFSGLTTAIQSAKCEETDGETRRRAKQIESVAQVHFGLIEAIIAALRRDLPITDWPDYDHAKKEITLDPELYDIYRSIQSLFRLINSRRERMQGTGRPIGETPSDDAHVSENG